MSGMKDDDDPKQKRDPWGGVFQNEYGRILGRMESKLDEHGAALRDLKQDAKQSTEDRTRGFAEIRSVQTDIENRVRANAHKTANDLQGISNRVEGLDGKLVNVQVSVDTANKRMEQQGVELAGVSSRVGKLEAPLAEALVLRDKRRARRKQWFLWLSGAILFLWGGLEPLYRVIVPAAIQKWLGWP